MDLNTLVQSSWTVQTTDANSGVMQGDTIGFQSSGNGVTITISHLDNTTNITTNRDWATGCQFTGSSLTGSTTAGTFTITFNDPATTMTCHFTSISISSQLRSAVGSPAAVRSVVLSAAAGALIGATAASVTGSRILSSIFVGAFASTIGALLSRIVIADQSTGTGMDWTAQDKGTGAGRHWSDHHRHAGTA